MAPENDSIATPAQLLLREVWSRGDLALVGEIIAADYTQVDPVATAPLSGPQALRAHVADRRRGVPDLRRTIERTLVDGATVGLPYVETGTHEGELIGLEPTGRRFRIPGVFVGRVSDGRLVEGTDLWDVPGLLRQLGATPDELAAVVTHKQP